MLSSASAILENDLTGFDTEDNNFLDDELKSQYISYIYSCAVSDILKYQGIKAGFVSGYSMGIYAALYYCGAIGFVEGLWLIRHAWDSISESCGDHKHGMGMIIGLEKQEVLKWCDDAGDTWICNQNNPHTYLISGRLESVNRILSLAKEEGALRANRLPVSKPYHTEVLKEASDSLRTKIERLNFNDPEVPYISSINGKIISTGFDFKEEVILNIYHRMNWYETMKSLVEHGTEVFFECGAGDGLTRNFRFIKGEFKAYSIQKLEQFLLTVKS